MPIHEVNYRSHLNNSPFFITNTKCSISFSKPILSNPSFPPMEVGLFFFTLNLTKDKPRHSINFDKLLAVHPNPNVGTSTIINLRKEESNYPYYSHNAKAYK